MRLALPKKNRLIGKKEIDRVIKKGKNIKGIFLSIRLLKNQEKGSRLVFIVPSKHISSAVNRNKIKRILSEEVKKNSGLLNSRYDIIVFVSKKIEKNFFGQLTAELAKMLLKHEGNNF